jgi:hypothetical protein
MIFETIKKRLQCQLQPGIASKKLRETSGRECPIVNCSRRFEPLSKHSEDRPIKQFAGEKWKSRSAEIEMHGVRSKSKLEVFSGPACYPAALRFKGSPPFSRAAIYSPLRLHSGRWITKTVRAWIALRICQSSW